jgi:hypothetical protein
VGSPVEMVDEVVLMLGVNMPPSMASSKGPTHFENGERRRWMG